MGKPIASLLLVMTIALAGCVDDMEPPGTEAAAFINCPQWGCGANSPLMGPYGFHELDASGAPSPDGLRLVGLVKNGVMYTPSVVGAKLYGKDTNGNVVLSGAALAGSYLMVLTPTGWYRINITHVSNDVTFWIGPATTIETYQLTYVSVGQAVTHEGALCKDPPNREDGEGRPWKQTLEAIIYTGDRYDADTKRLTASTYETAGSYFNIACAGSALAKLHLTRHTTAGSTSVYSSTLWERQAMLKMYVSDVCGTGDAFTVQGTPLHWANSKHWAALTGWESAYEGLWNSQGALCLEEHRLQDLSVTTQIKNLCASVNHPLPSCSSLSGFPSVWPRGTYLISAVP